MAQPEVDIEDLLDSIDDPVDLTTDPEESKDETVGGEDTLGVHADGETGAHDYYEDIRYMPTDEACETVVKIFEDQLQQRGNLVQFLLHEGGLNMIDWWEDRAGRNYGPELNEIAKIERSIKHSLSFLTGSGGRGAVQAERGSQAYEQAATSLVEGVKTLVQIFMAGNQHVQRQSSAAGARQVVPSPSVDGGQQQAPRSKRSREDEDPSLQLRRAADGGERETARARVAQDDEKAAPEAGMGAPYRVPTSALIGAREDLRKHRVALATFREGSTPIVLQVQKLLQNPPDDADNKVLKPIWNELKRFRKRFRKGLPPSEQVRAVTHLRDEIAKSRAAQQAAVADFFSTGPFDRASFEDLDDLAGAYLRFEEKVPDALYDTSKYDMRAMYDEAMRQLWGLPTSGVK
jgi:hypothetical protein